MEGLQWYELENREEVDSPALLIYPDRIQSNILEMIRIAGEPSRLMPHVKTHKMGKIAKMELKLGIRRFKCATIAEAEMLAISGAPEVLMAYQLNKTKALRLIELIRHYPETHFSSLVDNGESARLLSVLFGDHPFNASVYIDIDDGMHRTGMSVDKDIPVFFSFLRDLPNIDCAGFHIYDGHIHTTDFDERKRLTMRDFQPVYEVITAIRNDGNPGLRIVAGGSPTFPIYAKNTDVLCSPGTNVLWDAGYAGLLPDQHFQWAAVLLTRIISKPDIGFLTFDLGHKSVASENPLDKRVRFLNLDGYQLVSQSEEHLVVRVDKAIWNRIRIGDVFYAVPYHVCPTVALYDDAVTIRNGKAMERWEIEARKRKINI